MLTNWWGRQNAMPLKYDQKPSDMAFSVVFFLQNCPREVADDIIFGVAEEKVGMNVHAKLGYSTFLKIQWLNY